MDPNEFDFAAWKKKAAEGLKAIEAAEAAIEKNYAGKIDEILRKGTDMDVDEVIDNYEWDQYIKEQNRKFDEIQREKDKKQCEQKKKETISNMMSFFTPINVATRLGPVATSATAGMIELQLRQRGPKTDPHGAPDYLISDIDPEQVTGDKPRCYMETRERRENTAYGRDKCATLKNTPPSQDARNFSSNFLNAFNAMSGKNGLF